MTLLSREGGLFLFGNFLYLLSYFPILAFDLRKDENEEHQVITAATLRLAIVRALNVLGTTTVDHILYELERGGMDFEKGESFTVYQMEQIMEELFGGEAASLIMERVLAELSKDGVQDDKS